MDPRSIFSHVFDTEAYVAGVVFAIVCLSLLIGFWLSYRRRRRDRSPSVVDKNTPLEIGFAACFAAVAAFVVGLSFHSSAQEQTHGTARHVVDVTAFRWCWKFAYPEHHVQATGSCAGGERPTMMIPVGERVTIKLRSTDVIHSWWVPDLRYKMDAFPDHTNSFTIRVDRAGRWIGRCAEFCGERHYEMDFWLRAVPAKRYQQWLAGSGTSA
jgi:cytochrome c oxidase subunit 2